MIHPSIVALAILCCVALPALAAPRTFVASNDNDADPCTITQPCRSFAAAILRTDGGGEIVAVDSAGYGGVAIDRSVAIIAAPGAFAGVTVSSGDAIAIGASGLDVTLRGLTINGLGTGSRGVAVSAASRVAVEDCVIAAFAGQGIDIQADGAMVRVVRSSLYGHGNRGVSASGASTLDVEAVRLHDVHGPGPHVERGASATVSRSSIEANRRGVTVFGNLAGAQTRVVLVDSTIADSTFTGVWVRSLIAGGAASVELTSGRVTGNGAEGVRVDAADGASGSASVARSTVSGNAHGIVNGGTAGATIVVSRSVIAGNGAFALEQVGGVLMSRGDSAVHDNNGGGAQVSGTVTPLAPK